MPTPTNVLLLLTAAFLLSAVPGPDMLYIIARSTGQGRPAGFISCLGIAAAGLIQTSVVSLGLSGFFLMLPISYDATRYVGEVILFYLRIPPILNRQEVLTTPATDK